MSERPDSPEQRLRELGVELPEPPAPAAAYVGTQRGGGLLFTAGQVAVRDGALVHRGLLGAEVTLEQGQECARVCAVNVLAQLRAALGSLDRVGQVVKLTVFVASADGFTDQHLVANGASQLIGDVLGDRGAHARSAVGVAQLPVGSPVEVEAVVAVE